MVGLIRVTDDTVEKYGFFCKMSARKTKAWQDKRAWLSKRFAEGLEIHLLDSKERGFIETIPGARCWRAIDGAEEYLAIHCLWVVGKSKGKGHSTLLLGAAEELALEKGFKGLVALTSPGNWLMPPNRLEKHGFERIETHADYVLQVKSFGPASKPRLSGNWEAKAEACGAGLTVLRSAQCPYLEDATANARSAAEKLNLGFQDQILESAEDLRRLSPTPYGVFALVLNGKLLSPYYLLEKQILKAAEPLLAS